MRSDPGKNDKKAYNFSQGEVVCLHGTHSRAEFRTVGKVLQHLPAGLYQHLQVHYTYCVPLCQSFSAEAPRIRKKGTSPVGSRPSIGRWPASPLPGRSDRPDLILGGRAVQMPGAVRIWFRSCVVLHGNDITYQYMRRMGGYVYEFVQHRRRMERKIFKGSQSNLARQKLEVKP